MAQCPQCSAEMSQTEVRCSECGYDFPSPPSEQNAKHGIIYSPLANFALFVGSFVAGLCCIGAVVGAFTNLLAGNYLSAFVFSPVAFFLGLAMLVVFLRTADQDAGL